jgi:S1-C subfamily serine protease
MRYLSNTFFLSLVLSLGLGCSSAHIRTRTELIVEPTKQVLYGYGTSSGVIITEEKEVVGYRYFMLTAAHCVGYKGSICDIVVDNLNLRGTVLKTDNTIDLALVSIYSSEDFCDPVNMVKEDLELFSKVRVVGYPAGIGPVSSIGEVSGLINGEHAINAPIYFGNSGGPVFSEDNKLAGIITKVMTTENDVICHMGIYVPISVIRNFLIEFSKETS